MMQMITYEYKLYSSRRNKKLNKMIDLSAIIWNHCIALHRRFYKLFHKYLKPNVLKKHLTKLKKLNKYNYIKELDAQSVQDIVERIDLAYQKFFKDYKNKKKCSIPKFKKIRKYKSFTLKQNGYKFIDETTVIIKQQKYRFHKNQKLEGDVKTVTVKRDSLGDVYLFVVCKVDKPQVLSRIGNKIGYDFGLKTFLTASTSYKDDVISPLFFKKNINEIKRLCKNLSKKDKNSNNYQRAQKQLARLYKRITNLRKDFHYKTAYDICNKYTIICIEDLNIKAMQKLWGRKINDLGFYNFVQILEYVAKKCGCEVRKANKFFASSQTCSCCGNINKQVKDLRIRTWQCSVCNTIHDRDRNAAINILNACV